MAKSTPNENLRLMHKADKLVKSGYTTEAEEIIKIPYQNKEKENIFHQGLIMVTYIRILINRHKYKEAMELCEEEILLTKKGLKTKDHNYLYYKVYKYYILGLQGNKEFYYKLKNTPCYKEYMDRAIWQGTSQICRLTHCLCSILEYKYNISYGFSKNDDIYSYYERSDLHYKFLRINSGPTSIPIICSFLLLNEVSEYVEEFIIPMLLQELRHKPEMYIMPEIVEELYKKKTEIFDEHTDCFYPKTSAVYWINNIVKPYKERLID